MEEQTSVTCAGKRVQSGPPSGSGSGGTMRRGEEEAVKVRRSTENDATSSGRGVRRICAFFLMMGLLACILNCAINHGLRRAKTSKFGAFNSVMNGRVHADVLVNGSSRALSHYDPRIIENVTGLKAFNIGMNASQIDWQLVMLRNFLKHNSKPRIVLQNLDLFSLETTHKGRIYDPGLYVPYLYEDAIYKPLLKLDPDVWKWKYIPLYGYSVADMRFTWITGVLGCFGVYEREDYFLGFNPREGTWTEDFAHYKASASHGVIANIDPAGVSSLIDLVRTCRASGSDMILVYSPEYYEMQQLEKNRFEIFGRFKDLADRLGVAMWDYSASDICHKQELFENSQHLNARGAAVFSEDVASRLAEWLRVKEKNVALRVSDR